MWPFWSLQSASEPETRVDPPYNVFQGLSAPLRLTLPSYFADFRFYHSYSRIEDFIYSNCTIDLLSDDFLDDVLRRATVQVLENLWHVKRLIQRNAAEDLGHKMMDNFDGDVGALYQLILTTWVRDQRRKLGKTVYTAQENQKAFEEMRNLQKSSETWYRDAFRELADVGCRDARRWLHGEVIDNSTSAANGRESKSDSVSSSDGNSEPLTSIHMPLDATNSEEPEAGHEDSNKGREEMGSQARTATDAPLERETANKEGSNKGREEMGSQARMATDAPLERETATDKVTEGKTERKVKRTPFCEKHPGYTKSFPIAAKNVGKAVDSVERRFDEAVDNVRGAMHRVGLCFGFVTSNKTNKTKESSEEKQPSPLSLSANQSPQADKGVFPSPPSPAAVNPKKLSKNFWSRFRNSSKEKQPFPLSLSTNQSPQADEGISPSTPSPQAAAVNPKKPSKNCWSRFRNSSKEKQPFPLSLSANQSPQADEGVSPSPPSPAAVNLKKPSKNFWSRFQNSSKEKQPFPLSFSANQSPEADESISPSPPV